MTEKHTPAISVIVAVYKAESYIRRCLESIRLQTFTDFEALLIDDGSPDSSGAICDEYAARDSRFRVFHKENGGVSSARQCGIDNARGEYTIHIDPDDWVEHTMLELLYAKAIETGADMTVCNMITEYSGGTKLFTHCQDNEGIDIFDLKNIKGFESIYGSMLTNKLIKRCIYNHIKFPIELHSCEDSYVVIAALIKGSSYTSIHDVLYHYDRNNNSNSLTNNGHPNIDFMRNKIACYLLWIQNRIVNADFGNNLISKYAHTVFNDNCLTQKDYTQMFLPYWKIVLKSDINIRKKITVILSIFGLKNIIQKPYVGLKELYLKWNNRKSQ